MASPILSPQDLMAMHIHRLKNAEIYSGEYGPLPVLYDENGNDLFTVSEDFERKIVHKTTLIMDEMFTRIIDEKISGEEAIKSYSDLFNKLYQDRKSIIESYIKDSINDDCSLYAPFMELGVPKVDVLMIDCFIELLNQWILIQIYCKGDRNINADSVRDFFLEMKLNILKI